MLVAAFSSLAEDMQIVCALMKTEELGNIHACFLQSSEIAFTNSVAKVIVLFKSSMCVTEAGP